MKHFLLFIVVALVFPWVFVAAQDDALPLSLEEDAFVSGTVFDTDRHFESPTALARISLSCAVGMQGKPEWSLLLFFDRKPFDPRPSYYREDARYRKLASRTEAVSLWQEWILELRAGEYCELPRPVTWFTRQAYLKTTLEAVAKGKASLEKALAWTDLPPGFRSEAEMFLAALESARQAYFSGLYDDAGRLSMPDYYGSVNFTDRAFLLKMGKSLGSLYRGGGKLGSASDPALAPVAAKLAAVKKGFAEAAAWMAKEPARMLQVEEVPALVTLDAFRALSAEQKEEYLEKIWPHFVTEELAIEGDAVARAWAEKYLGQDRVREELSAIEEYVREQREEVEDPGAFIGPRVQVNLTACQGKVLTYGVVFFAAYEYSPGGDTWGASQSYIFDRWGTLLSEDMAQGD